MVNIKPNYEYPEPKLLYKLVDTYFREVNIFMPILHRPTFENAVGDGLHLRDAGFGSLLLVVCAVATTFSNGEAFDYATRSSRVSPWFLQVQRSNQSILGPVRLYDVQMAFVGCLSECVSLTDILNIALIGLFTRFVSARERLANSWCGNQDVSRCRRAQAEGPR